MIKDYLKKISLTNTDEIEIDSIVEKYGRKTNDGKTRISRCRFRKEINGYSFDKISKNIQFFECEFIKPFEIHRTIVYTLDMDTCVFDNIRCEERISKLILNNVYINKFECFPVNSNIRIYPNHIKEIYLGGSESEFLLIGGKCDLIDVSKNNFNLPCIINIEGVEIGIFQLFGKLENVITLTNIKIKKLFISRFINKGYIWIRNLQLNENIGNIKIRISDLGGVRFVDCELHKFKYNINATDLSRTIFINCGYINYDGEGSQKDIYRQLKSSCKANEDTESYLYYRSKELDAYRKELKKTKSIFNGDRIILFLSRISNFYGFRWLSALGFIFIVAIIFFIFILMSLNDSPIKICSKFPEIFFNSLETFDFKILSNCLNGSNWNELVKSFVIFLNPAHSFDYLNGFQPSGWAYIWDLLGRIFIGFGIYQLIRAFRKFVF